METAVIGRPRAHSSPAPNQLKTSELPKARSAFFSQPASARPLSQRVASPGDNTDIFKTALTVEQFCSGTNQTIPEGIRFEDLADCVVEYNQTTGTQATFENNLITFTVQDGPTPLQIKLGIYGMNGKRYLYATGPFKHAAAKTSLQTWETIFKRNGFQFTLTRLRQSHPAAAATQGLTHAFTLTVPHNSTDYMVSLYWNNNQTEATMVAKRMGIQQQDPPHRSEIYVRKITEERRLAATHRLLL